LLCLSSVMKCGYVFQLNKPLKGAFQTFC